MLTFNKVINLPTEDSGITLSIARFNNSNIDSKKNNKAKFFRREPLVIINKKNNQRIIRYAYGNGNPQALSLRKNHLAIDYDGLDALGLKRNDECELLVKRADLISLYMWLFSHPDVSIRHGIILGFMGFVLGVMGFAGSF